MADTQITGVPTHASTPIPFSLTDAALAALGAPLPQPGPCAEGALAGACDGSDCGQRRISNEPVHQTPLVGFKGPEFRPGETLLAFCLQHFPEDEPKLTFEIAGRFVDLDIEETDELLAGLAEHLEQMRAARDLLAHAVAAHRVGSAVA